MAPVRPPDVFEGQRLTLNPALAAWAVEAGIITIRDLTQSRRFPLPSEFLSTFIVFGTLTALGGTSNGRRPAGAIAWGLVVATLLSSRVDVLKPVGDFLTPSSATRSVQPSSSVPSTDLGNINKLAR